MVLADLGKRLNAAISALGSSPIDEQVRTPRPDSPHALRPADLRSARRPSTPRSRPSAPLSSNQTSMFASSRTSASASRSRSSRSS